jgi:undecaprenyl diphosphate synthase
VSHPVDTDNQLKMLEPERLPKHVAIIMDGNGRWAEKQNKPRVVGHRTGVETVRNVVKMSRELGIEVLTLFAFSSENWRRPAKEVGMLMELFMLALDREVKKLHKNNVQLKVTGDISAFSEKIQKRVREAEFLTQNNTGLILNIAANYGGKWDIQNSVRKLAKKIKSGELQPEDITSESVNEGLSTYGLPEPDLFIRTGGEQRISNFLIWQLAYTELYFTRVLWPDFTRTEYEKALISFSNRQRRFGCTGQQVENFKNA